MSNKPISAEDIRSLWQKMPSDSIVVTFDEMRARARKFQSRIRLRNFIEYIAYVVVLFGFGRLALNGPTWQAQTAGILIILGATLAVWNLHRKGRASATPAGLSTAALIDFQRSELTRQRDALRSIWRWYLLPFVPGFAFFSVIAWMGYLRNGVPIERLHANIIVTDIFFVSLCAIIILLNLLGAAHLQRMIEDLDRYKEKL